MMNSVFAIQKKLFINLIPLYFHRLKYINYYKYNSKFHQSFFSIHINFSNHSFFAPLFISPIETLHSTNTCEQTYVFCTKTYKHQSIFHNISPLILRTYSEISEQQIVEIISEFWHVGITVIPSGPFVIAVQRSVSPVIWDIGRHVFCIGDMFIIDHPMVGAYIRGL